MIAAIDGAGHLLHDFRLAAALLAAAGSDRVLVAGSSINGWPELSDRICYGLPSQYG